MITVLRRTFLLCSAAATLTGLNRAAAQTPQPAPQPVDLGATLTYPYAVPALPYAYDANEPSVDRQTMELHHDRHHVAYVNNLNAALKDRADLQELTLRALLQAMPQLPEAIRTTVRNNAGGHANHTMFWQVMGGHGGAPSGDIAAVVDRDFGSLDALKTAFNKAAAGVFGSGWAMVLTDKAGKLTLATGPNQDSPLMDGRDVVFGNDVWEHSYYLKYQNRRPDYLAAWWNVLDWERIGQRYAAARAGTLAV